MLAKKAPVLIIAKVIETLAIFTAPKNVNQCKAIRTPTPASPKSVFPFALSEIPLIFM